jgi:UDP-N-acetylmuramoylalanine--D-glutamate ligase
MSHASEQVLVLGLGRSGSAAVALLLRDGARVSAYDRDPTRGESLPEGVERLGGPEPPPFDAYDRVVVSPGFPVAPDPRVIPEVDLAAAALRVPLLAVTGTNGKSTTVVLIGEMLRCSGVNVALGGNLGTPLSELVDVPCERVVAELSSFQLEHARALRPDVAVLLNLAPDHLDRHGSLEAYAAAKRRLADGLSPEGTLVANLDDCWARGVAEQSRSRVLGFSERRRLAEGAFLDGKDLVVVLGGQERLRVACESLSEAACAPLGNALAAAAAALVCGAEPQGVREALAAFEALPHRARLVAVRRGVRWIDDSKATNPEAAARRLASQSSPVVWIAGGLNKGLDFAPLRAAMGGVRAAILIGGAAGELAAALAGTTEIVIRDTLDAAVPEAARRARAGDVALLAPACSSFDQFVSFEERGARFAALVRALPEGPPC